MSENVVVIESDEDDVIYISSSPVRGDTATPPVVLSEDDVPLPMEVDATPYMETSLSHETEKSKQSGEEVLSQEEKDVLLAEVTDGEKAKDQYNFLSNQLKIAQQEFRTLTGQAQVILASTPAVNKPPRTNKMEVDDKRYTNGGEAAIFDDDSMTDYPATEGGLPLVRILTLNEKQEVVRVPAGRSWDADKTAVVMSQTALERMLKEDMNQTDDEPTDEDLCKTFRFNQNDDDALSDSAFFQFSYDPIPVIEEAAARLNFKKFRPKYEELNERLNANETKLQAFLEACENTSKLLDQLRHTIAMVQAKVLDYETKCRSGRYGLLLATPGALPSKPNDDVIAVAGPTPKKMPDLPPDKPLNLLPIVVGLKVYAQKTNLHSQWYLASVTDMSKIADGPAAYRIKFEKTKYKQYNRLCPGKQLATVKAAEVILPVGSRIIAAYHGGSEQNFQMYVGVVAEKPTAMNKFRYLVVFDDGYVQYNPVNEVNPLYEWNKEAVWEDVHEDIQDFLKQYLAQFPERPMVKLTKGQMVKTEWNRTWYDGRVEEVDASLAKIYFASDQRVEWIYRGSRRLGPLYIELDKQKGSKRRQKADQRKKDAPYVEYTRNAEEEPTSPDISVVAAPKQTVTARKHTGGANAGQPPLRRPSAAEMEIADILQQKSAATELHRPSGMTITPFNAPQPIQTLNAPVNQPLLVNPSRAGAYIARNEMAGTYSKKMRLNIDKRRLFQFHSTCGPQCVFKGDDNPDRFKGSPPLLIPFKCGWERHTRRGKFRRAHVIYRSWCGRTCRNIAEVMVLLKYQGSRLTIDLFTFDVEVQCFFEFGPLNVVYFLPDLSYGRENIPVTACNSLNNEDPPYIEYCNVRLPVEGIDLVLDPEFMVCCDCEDQCVNAAKCACQQLTQESTMIALPEYRMEKAGYVYRRLEEPTCTGIYECNQRCKCKAKGGCVNRVVQNGLIHNVQIFKTAKKGWGLRALHDIPKGTFICNYTGRMLTEDIAVKDGTSMGDEYQAELDYIESLEGCKPGYESEPEDPEANDDPGSPVKAPVSGNRAMKSTSGRKSIAKKSGSGQAKAPKEKDSDSESDDCPDAGHKDNYAEDEDFNPAGIDLPSTVRQRATMRRSTNRVEGKSQSAKKSTSTSRNVSPTNASKQLEKKDVPEKAATPLSKTKYPRTRTFFGSIYPYIMDAKQTGNLGRYLNHSCEPNCFVQNVFVDTHDIRAPWVCFFSSEYIKGGQELTWDYNYQVNSVPDKTMYCFCESENCRKRLL